MVTQPTYLANLKAYGRARWKDDEEANAAANNLINDESDRGAIIMAATNVEDMLEYEILHRLPALHADETARKNMFEQDGPISTFTRKIGMAYAMGIIDKEYRKRIDLVREIRNTAAHSRLPVAGDVPAIRAAIEVLIRHTIENLRTDKPAAYRNAFVIECGLLSHYIASGEKIEGVQAAYAYWQSLQDP
jgi:hypothetical protein